MPNTQSQTLVMDIGKTHVKIQVLDESHTPIFSKNTTNQVKFGQEYPCADTDGIWDFLKASIKEACETCHISAVCVTTHGATAALINRNTQTEQALVLPVLDYEYQQVHSTTPEYETVRPEFKNTYSPSLPGGLNLGRQLYWLKQNYPNQFSEATDILMYPQYWVWRLTGNLFSEITSLGCHTDLWDIRNDSFSSLVDVLECRDKFPPIQPAWHCCGTVNKDLAQELGLSEQTKVYNGLHDSNASYLRYRLSQGESSFTVISSGTWTICMDSSGNLDNLNPDHDMLANIDALHCPVTCARFMGGREFNEICKQTGVGVDEHFCEVDVQNVIDNQVFALPNFAGGSGPFNAQKARFEGDYKAYHGGAIATLYIALLVDYQLTKLGSTGNIYIEGAFLRNPILCELIQQLRGEQRVFLSLDDTGTVAGTASLSHWNKGTQLEIAAKEVFTKHFADLSAYKAAWLNKVTA